MGAVDPEPGYLVRCKCGAPLDTEMAWERRQCEDCAKEPTCRYCGTLLGDRRVIKDWEEAEAEIAHGICEGCAIDLWEEQQRKREQEWLEDDRNWEV